jgi:phospholipid-binding lipoprotein MlaA
LSLPAPRDRRALREVRKGRSDWSSASLAVLACLLLAACAHAPNANLATDQVYDPAEKANRAVFGFNHAVDHAAIAPVARGYRAVVPSRGRQSVTNVTSNLKGPETAINDLLQANFRRAGTSSARFAINSTLGVAGIFDVAQHWGMPSHEADMGQTFGRWGMPAGPAVQIPLLGPSNLRDVTGGVIGSALDPTTYLTGGAAIAVRVVAATGLVNGRAELLPLTDKLEATAPDYYAALRDRAAKARIKLVAQAQHPMVGEPDEADDIPAPKPAEPPAPSAPAQSPGPPQP